jgi:hypothetical protein
VGVVFRDPVQLNLLYEQAKEQILEGTHPVEIDKAITFAAYQVWIIGTKINLWCLDMDWYKIVRPIKPYRAWIWVVLNCVGR